jgi:hypothetical protein
MLGGAALGGLAGFSLAEPEHRGLGVAAGALGGAGMGLSMNMADDMVKRISQVQRTNDPVETAKIIRQNMMQVSPSIAGATAGGTLGAIIGGDNDINSDEGTGMNMTRAMLLGALAGGSTGAAGSYYKNKLDDILMDRSIKRRTRWADEAARPRQGTVVGAQDAYLRKLPPPAKTAEFATPGRALLARTGFGAAVGGAGGALYAPQMAGEKRRSAAEEERLRIRGALIGALVGGAASGGSKYLAQKSLKRMGDADPHVTELANDLNREFI